MSAAPPNDLAQQLQFLKATAAQEIRDAARAYYNTPPHTEPTENRAVFHAALYKAAADQILTKEEIADAARLSRQWLYRILNRAAPAAPADVALPKDDA